MAQAELRFCEAWSKCGNLPCCFCGKISRYQIERFSLADYLYAVRWPLRIVMAGDLIRLIGLPRWFVMLFLVAAYL